MERAAYYSEYGEKKLRGVLYTGSAAFGNAATRLESYVVGRRPLRLRQRYPDIDGLFAEQVNEMNPRVRQQMLHKIQQMMHERVMFIPVMETAFLNGVGPAGREPRPQRDRGLRLLGAVRGPADSGRSRRRR